MVRRGQIPPHRPSIAPGHYRRWGLNVTNAGRWFEGNEVSTTSR